MERRHGVERWAGASRAFGFGGNLAAALRVLEQVTQSIPQSPALYQSISPRAAAAGGSSIYSTSTFSCSMTGGWMVGVIQSGAAIAYGNPRGDESGFKIP